MCCCELNSSRNHHKSFQLLFCVSDSASGNLRLLWLLRSLNGQFLSVTPGWASILINEWVSLWDHFMVWGLGLHLSCKFLSPEKTETSWVESRLFRAKFSCIFLTFILKNSINAVKLRKSVRSASYLTTQPRPFSPLQRSDLDIFQLSPEYSLIFFPSRTPLPRTIPLVGQLSWHLSASPPLSIFWLGRNSLISFNQAPLSV